MKNTFKHTRLYQAICCILMAGMVFSMMPKAVKADAVSFSEDTYVQAESGYNFADFIERLYNVALNRPSEKAGKDFWIEKVTKDGFTGADCARNFLIYCPEFGNRKLSNAQIVDTMYKTFFDRAGEKAGRDFWIDYMKTHPMEDVVNGFINSTEWCNLCAKYEVRSGAVPWVQSEYPSQAAIDFVEHLYQVTEKYDRGYPKRVITDEIKHYYAMEVTNYSGGAAEAVMFFTTESLDDGVIWYKSNHEFIKCLYECVLNRTPSEKEVSYWISVLFNNQDYQVACTIATSDEFKSFCYKHGFGTKLPYEETVTTRLNVPNSPAPTVAASIANDKAIISKAVEQAIKDYCSWKSGFNFNSKFMKEEQHCADEAHDYYLYDHTFINHDAEGGCGFEGCYSMKAIWTEDYNRTGKFHRYQWSGYGAQFETDLYTAAYNSAVYCLTVHCSDLSENANVTEFGYGVAVIWDPYFMNWCGWTPNVTYYIYIGAEPASI